MSIMATFTPILSKRDRKELSVSWSHSQKRSVHMTVNNTGPNI